MSPFRKLYSQVLIGIAAGVLLGVASPAWGLAVKPLGDAFVALLRMLLAPIIFCPVQPRSSPELTRVGSVE